MTVMWMLSMDTRAWLYIGCCLCLLPMKVVVMAQTKEIVGCCGGEFNAKMRCDDGSVITVQDVVLARNKWCLLSRCCTKESDCETSAKNTLPEYYASIMKCAGKSKCRKQTPDKCPDIPRCSEFWGKKFIRIEYTCTLDVFISDPATPSPTTQSRWTPMDSDKVTSISHVTTAKDVTPAVTVVTHLDTTNAGIWVGVSLVAVSCIVAAASLIIVCTRVRRNPDSLKPAQDLHLVVKKQGRAARSAPGIGNAAQTVVNENVYVMNIGHGPDYDHATAITDDPPDYQYATVNRAPGPNPRPCSQESNPQDVDLCAYDTAGAVLDEPSAGDVSYYATPRSYGNTEVAKSGPPEGRARCSAGDDDIGQRGSSGSGVFSRPN